MRTTVPALAPDDVQAEHKALKARGVVFKVEPGKVPGFPAMATFDDTCGNYIMMFEIEKQA